MEMRLESRRDRLLGHPVFPGQIAGGWQFPPELAFPDAPIQFCRDVRIFDCAHRSFFPVVSMDIVISGNDFFTICKTMSPTIKYIFC
ncbi:hypothetical protein SDC9_199878 [bioreactor metagenome]|uniref:Uncharacterized protein n=1 Tax=bioreactor metagenome TaxID=1076179 RepID=A0A645IMZ8_9ZZZZ